jgi:Ca2+-transporting ATPase
LSFSPDIAQNRVSGPLIAHTLTAAAVAQALGADQQQGLSSAEAQRRLAADGPNLFKAEKPVTIWQVVARQFASFLIAILILAGIISLVAGEIGDAIVIWAIVALNAALGAFQELRAKRALEALRQVVTPTAQVIREGTVREIPAAELVLGDLVVLRAGDLAPADLRLTEAHSLSVDESPLTGESVPVQKSADALLEERAALGDRANCVYMGTSIAYGRGAGIVYATGMNTRLGEIAHLVSSHQRVETPLQQKLGILGKQLGVIALVLCLIIFITGWLRGQGLLETFLVAVSLAVAAIPEGLPAVVTIALALGLQRMLRRHALVRRLAAVETLGAATVICTDKTGTLTPGEMAVERLHLAGTNYHLESSRLRRESQAVEVVDGSLLHTMLLGMALCNDATLEQASDGSLQTTGSPTEVALVRAAQRLLGETAWKG